MMTSSSNHHHHHHHNPSAISRRYHLITDPSLKNDDGKFILINSQELKLYQSWRSTINHQKSNHNQSYLHHRLIYNLNNLPQAKVCSQVESVNQLDILLTFG